MAVPTAMARVASAILIAGAVVALQACTAAPAPELGSPAEPAAAAPLAHMSPADKRAQIDPSFPIEVPVPAGSIVEGNAQGTDAWDYVIEADAGAPELAQWYREAYTGRGWTLVAEEPRDGQLSLTFRKAAAESRVELPAEGDAPTRALVIVGVGVPVLETQ